MMVERKEGQFVLCHGFGAPEAFMGERMAEMAEDILRNRSAEALQYGPGAGFSPLREIIAGWHRQEGIEANAGDIRIITGAKQGLYMVARALSSAGDHVLLGQPTYMTGLQIFRQAARLKCIPVTQTERGLDVDEVERMLRAATPRPKFIYDISDFHNPTGAVMPAEERERLVWLAGKYEVPIVVDRPYRWLRFEGEPVPPLKHFDKTGSVVTVGTFSKILAPGLRVGWVHAHPEILKAIAPLKVDGGTCPLPQMILTDMFTEEGSLERRLQAQRGTYKSKRDAALEALAGEFRGTSATWSTPEGGYYIWLTLPGVDTEKFAVAADAIEAKAVHKGQQVTFVRGSAFHVSSDHPRHFARLSYSYETEDRLRAGVSVLARSVLEQLS